MNEDQIFVDKEIMEETSYMEETLYCEDEGDDFYEYRGFDDEDDVSQHHVDMEASNEADDDVAEEYLEANGETDDEVAEEHQTNDEADRVGHDTSNGEHSTLEDRVNYLTAESKEIKDAANKLAEQQKELAIAQIRLLMQHYNITVSELGTMLKAESKIEPGMVFTNPKTGETWERKGRGRRPTWVNDLMAQQQMQNNGR